MRLPSLRVTPASSIPVTRADDSTRTPRATSAWLALSCRPGTKDDSGDFKSSISTMLGSPEGIPGKSLPVISATRTDRAAEPSTPVGPPPTTAKVSRRARSAGLTAQVAASKQDRMRFRSAWVAPRSFSLKLRAATPALWKYSLTAPAAMMR